MGLRIIGNGNLENNIAKAQKEYENSVEKLSSGVRFTRSEPMPAERARSDALTSKMRELNVYKQNVNEGLSITESAESELSSMTNNVIRLKELVAQATNPNLSDKERAFIFIEYQANFEDLEKASSKTNYLASTESQGIENVIGKSPDTIQIRVGAPAMSDGKDTSVVTLDGLNNVKTTPNDLGIKSAENLVNLDDGVSIDDVLNNFDVSNDSELGESFDNAQLKLSSYRAKFGAATSRLSSALNSISVAYENTTAANSKIKDVDYATEITNLAKANILVQASTSLLAQRNNNTAQNILTLVRSSNKNS
jgi:flagellin